MGLGPARLTGPFPTGAEAEPGERVVTAHLRLRRHPRLGAGLADELPEVVVVARLLLFASLKHREISIDLAREALSDRIRPSENGGPREATALPSIDKVQEVVARRWGVTPEGLRSKARIKTLTVPRQIAMYLARELLQMQLVEIGQAFGGRDHSTVIHSVDKIQRQMARDRGFRERVELARQELCAQ